MILTYTLVIIFKLGSGTAVTNIPAYSTLQECERVATITRQMGASTYLSTPITVCLPHQ